MTLDWRWYKDADHSRLTAVFEHAEPYAYPYVYDDATSTFTCTGECDYRITFGTTP
ncbi:MAG TPA: thaumatin family protein [Pseudonocardiaceae bacterium]|nr:thaumatin family protein [Pseudonocardiaceae bacterium]